MLTFLSLKLMIAHISQGSITVRYMNSEDNVVKQFLGFHDVRSFDALFNLLDEALSEFS